MEWTRRLAGVALAIGTAVLVAYSVCGWREAATVLSAPARHSYGPHATALPAAPARAPCSFHDLAQPLAAALRNASFANVGPVALPTNAIDPAAVNAALLRHFLAPWLHGDAPGEPVQLSWGGLLQGLEAAGGYARVVLAVVGGQVHVHLRAGYMERIPCNVWLLASTLRRHPRLLQHDFVAVFSAMDEPQLARADGGQQAPSDTFPVLSYSRTSDYADVLVPDFAFCHWRDTGNPMYWAEYLRRRERVELARAPLTARKRLAILRSGLNSYVKPAGPRQLLVNHVHSLPEPQRSLFDVEFQMAADPLDHCRHRYLMVVEGYAWTARTKWWMACGAVTMYGEGDHEEWIRPALVPWLHYVPIHWHGNGVEVSVTWLEENPQAAQRIAAGGTAFAEAMFDEAVVLDYLAGALQAVAAMQAHLPLSAWFAAGYQRAGLRPWEGWSNVTASVVWQAGQGGEADPLDALVAPGEQQWQFTSEPAIPIDALTAAAAAAEAG